MCKLLKWNFQKTLNRTKKTARQRQRAFCCAIDALESRRLLSAVVTTTPATAVTTTSATLNGTVNASGGAVTDAFQYSTDPTFPATVQTTVHTGFNDPDGVAFDSAGDLYVASVFNTTLLEYKVGQTSPIMVGSGFLYPQGVAVDSAGDIFVADAGNNAVKKIPAGSNTPVSIGSGFLNPTSVAVNSAGDVFVGNSGDNAVDEIVGSTTSVVLNSGLSNPHGVAVDAAGDVFVANTGDNSVVEISGGVPTSLGSVFNAPNGVAVNTAGTFLYVADTGNNVVKEIVFSSSIRQIGTLQSTPLGLVVDSAGDVVISNAGNNSVVEVAPPAVSGSPGSVSGSVVTSVTANLTGLTAGAVYYDRTIAYGSGGIGVAAGGSFKADPPPVVTTNAATGVSKTSATLNSMVNPEGMTATVQFQYSTTGSFPAVLSMQSTIGSNFNNPNGVAVDAAGDVFVADTGDNAVKEILINGTIQVLGSGFVAPNGVAVDPAGDVYVADTGNNAVKEILTNGTIKTIESGLSSPQDVVLDNAGDLLIANSGKQVIQEVPAGSTYPITLLSVGGYYPLQLAVDAAGDVFFTTYGAGIPPLEVAAGTTSPMMLNQFGYSNSWNGVAVDSAGNLYVSQRKLNGEGNQILELAAGQTNDIILAATGLNDPEMVTVDPFGDLLIADTGNSRVVELSQPNILATPPTVNASSATAVSGTLSGLTIGTTYYYRAAVLGINGAVYGTTPSFTTATLPTVGSAAAATPNPVVAGTATLSTLGVGGGGEGGLTYTWSVLGNPPGSVTFAANGTNAAKNTIATFSAIGTYNLLVTIADPYGDTVTSSVAVTDNTFTGSSGNDFIYLSRSGANVVANINGTQTTVPYSGLGAIGIFTGTGNDMLTVDVSGGNPIPAAGLTVTGGGGIDSLTLIGTTGNDTANVSAGSVNFNGSPITYTGIGSLTINGNGGNDTLNQTAQPTVNFVFNGNTSGGPIASDSFNISGGTFNFPAPVAGSGISNISIASLVVGTGATATFAAAVAGSGINAISVPAITLGANANVSLGTAAATSDRWVLVTSSLAFGNQSKLNLGGNDLLVHSTGSTPPAESLGILTAQLSNGYSNGAWTGFGIASTAAAASAKHHTALGVAPITAAGTFDSQPVTTTDVVVKYTYYGDANLDGKVDGSDYSKIDNGFANQLAGWTSGDFNYDSVINGSDYTLIDNAFNRQSAQITASVAAAAAVEIASAPAAPPRSTGVGTPSQATTEADKKINRAKIRKLFVW